LPTASQDVVTGQETLESPAVDEPAGFGVGWITQLLLFHLSASVRPT
jgi:hypothetical protein